MELYFFNFIFCLQILLESNGLQPYNKLQNSDNLSNLKEISQCPHEINGTEKHQIFNPNLNNSNVLLLKSFISYNDHSRTGHFSRVPLSHYKVTVVEPGGKFAGCKKSIKSTVKNTAEIHGACEIAMNAALFHKSIPCLGNLIIDGKRIRDSLGIQNAHFGILKNGSLFFGYLSEDEYLKDKFQTLVGGVIWLVNNGKPFVDQSLSYECAETEETGSLKRFVSVRSARTAVGHDSFGNVILIHVDGKTDRSGVNLHEFADMLINMGVINAVNFDGGGSATFVVNGTVVSYPSDQCKDDKEFSCERKVGTIFCVTRINSEETNSTILERKTDESQEHHALPIVYLSVIFVLFLIIAVCVILLVKIQYSKKQSAINGNTDVHYSLLNQIGSREILLASGVPSEIGSDSELNLMNER